LATQHGKENIRCNAIAPGLIVTPAIRSSRALGNLRGLSVYGNRPLTAHRSPGSMFDMANIWALLAVASASLATD
jgi:NAD(P)-dependent dehydrogenase (short-subunit alcohol dehydrogenase family)